MEYSFHIFQTNFHLLRALSPPNENELFINMGEYLKQTYFKFKTNTTTQYVT